MTVIQFGDKYRDAVALARAIAKAKSGTIVIVLDGARGDGWSAELVPEVFPLVPQILRRVADEIETARAELDGAHGNGGDGGGG